MASTLLWPCTRAYMEARIAPLNDEQTPSDTASEIGEIQVRGENVCMGYYKNPEQTAALFTEDGWMRTGGSRHDG